MFQNEIQIFNMISSAMEARTPKIVRFSPQDPMQNLTGSVMQTRRSNTQVISKAMISKANVYRYPDKMVPIKSDIGSAAVYVSINKMCIVKPSSLLKSPSSSSSSFQGTPVSLGISSSSSSSSSSTSSSSSNSVGSIKRLTRGEMNVHAARHTLTPLLDKR